MEKDCFSLTVELKRRWQMLQEMICFFLSGCGTPNVWLMTAFWTGSIWVYRHTRTHTHTERERESHINTHTQTQTEQEKKRERKSHRHKHTDTHTHTQTQMGMERETLLGHIVTQSKNKELNYP